MRQRLNLLISVLSLFLWISPLTFAQQVTPSFNKPLKIVVGFPPGGSADMLARALAQQMSGVALIKLS